MSIWTIKALGIALNWTNKLLFKRLTFSAQRLEIRKELKVTAIFSTPTRPPKPCRALKSKIFPKSSIRWTWSTKWNNSLATTRSQNTLPANSKRSRIGLFSKMSWMQLLFTRIKRMSSRNRAISTRSLNSWGSLLICRRYQITPIKWIRLSRIIRLKTFSRGWRKIWLISFWTRSRRGKSNFRGLFLCLTGIRTLKRLRISFKRIQMCLSISLPTRIMILCEIGEFLDSLLYHSSQNYDLECNREPILLLSLKRCQTLLLKIKWCKALRSNRCRKEGT